MDELKNVVTELQGLLADSNKKYTSLEDELRGINDKHKEELNGQNETIAALKKELENANKLIKTFKLCQCPPEDSELVNVKCPKDEGTFSFLFPTFQARLLK